MCKPVSDQFTDIMISKPTSMSRSFSSRCTSYHPCVSLQPEGRHAVTIRYLLHIVRCQVLEHPWGSGTERHYSKWSAFLYSGWLMAGYLVEIPIFSWGRDVFQDGGPLRNGKNPLQTRLPVSRGMQCRAMDTGHHMP